MTMTDDGDTEIKQRLNELERKVQELEDTLRNIMESLNQASTGKPIPKPIPPEQQRLGGSKHVITHFGL